MVYDAPAAIRTGYRVCSALNYANGEDVARDLYMTTSFADLPTLDSATSVVVSAGLNLCPWHYHPERAAAGTVVEPIDWSRPGQR